MVKLGRKINGFLLSMTVGGSYVVSFFMWCGPQSNLSWKSTSKEVGGEHFLINIIIIIDLIYI